MLSGLVVRFLIILSGVEARFLKNVLLIIGSVNLSEIMSAYKISL